MNIASVVRIIESKYFSFNQSEKVVVLEELAARFRLKTQAVINRVTDLQSDGTLSGECLSDRFNEITSYFFG